MLLGPIYDYLDGKLLGHSLRKNEADRLALRKEKELNGETFPGWQVSRTSLCIFGGQFALMILCSWVVSYLPGLADEMGWECLWIDLPLLHCRRSAAMRRGKRPLAARRAREVYEYRHNEDISTSVKWYYELVCSGARLGNALRTIHTVRSLVKRCETRP